MKSNKPIKIKISDGLSPLEESQEISSKLRQKLLASNANQFDKKRIGEGIDVKHLSTTIIIERTGEKPIEMVRCNVCGCEYQSDMYKPVVVNYGGKVKTIKTCSQNCQESLIELCGVGRAGKTKKELKPFRLWR